MMMLQAPLGIGDFLLLGGRGYVPGAQTAVCSMSYGHQPGRGCLVVSAEVTSPQ